MANHFMTTMTTPAVRKAQAHYYGAGRKLTPASGPDALGADEIGFIAARDSFYMATVSEDGWPYMQHRGGPAGFLKVLGPNQLGFADLTGNRQLISTGNLSSSDKVALFLMDYPHQSRLKLLGRARVLDARDNAPLADALTPSPGQRRRVERLFLIDVTGFDWNCQQQITPRYSEAELAAGLGPVR